MTGWMQWSTITATATSQEQSIVDIVNGFRLRLQEFQKNEFDSSMTLSFMASETSVTVVVVVAALVSLVWMLVIRRRRQRQQQQMQPTYTRHQLQQQQSFPFFMEQGTQRIRRLSSRTNSIGDNLQTYLLRQRSMTANTTTWVANAFADGGCMATSWRPWTSSRELLLAAPGDPFLYPEYYHYDAQDAMEMAHVSQELFFHIAEYEERQQQHQPLFVSPRFRTRTRSSPKVQQPYHHNHGSSTSPSTSFLQILGPSVDCICYRTMVPPPTWSEAGRNLMLSSDDLILSRTVTIHIPGIHQRNHDNNDYCTAKLSITKKSTTSKTTTALEKETIMTTTFSRSVEDCRIHIRRPAEGGVMDIYERDAPDRSHWMEHAFASAAQAAQFQLDLISLQMAGSIISNMYQAFAILHQGSMAYEGEEPVMHCDPHLVTSTFTAAGGIEAQKDSKPISSNASMTTAKAKADHEQEAVADSRPIIAQDSGIAWDDVMRCLGTTLPSIRLRLEAMWWLKVYRAAATPSAGGRRAKKDKVAAHRAATATTAKQRHDANITSKNIPHKHDAYRYLTAEYSNQNRRVLLGPVDFFRLFVPILPETAVPEGESSRLRMEKLLRWRKRIASAAVMVQAYTRAKIVANRGWKLGPKIILPENYFKRRLAFDDDADNRRHDAVAKNEYYEATVSRDIIFRVRCPNNTFSESTHRKKQINRNEIPHTQSLYQGYSLVGMHAFHCGQENGDGSGVLHYMRDPVQMIPSLRHLIEANSDLDFFVNTICAEAQNAVIVQVYVRSLPKGIDASFDITVNRFIYGDANLRNRKLHVILQLGIDRDIISWYGRFLLWWLSFLLRITSRRQAYLPQPAWKSDNRTFIPAINLSELGETYHFGGALQRNPDLPKNYVASTFLISSKRNNSIVTRMLLSYIEFGCIEQNVSDFTFFLIGESDDELPERALCTFRAVHSTMNSLQMSSFATASRPGTHLSILRTVAPLQRSQKGMPSLYFKIFVTDPSIAVATGLIRSWAGLRRAAQNINLATPLQALQPQSPENMIRRAAIDPTASDPFEKAVNDLVEILEDVRIPVRTRRDQTHVLTDLTAASTDFRPPKKFWASARGYDWEPGQENIGFRSILSTVSREDIKRYFIGSDCSLKTAAVRLVESSTWRAITFPIDVRTCRIELQNGQFFQQGVDKHDNPVFYFRNTCLGPWRKDENAVISAVLHRLEGSLNKLAKDDPYIKCTLVVVMGKPYKKKKYKAKEKAVGVESKKKTVSGGDDTSTRIEQSTIASTTVSTLTGPAGDVEAYAEDDESEDDDDVDDFDEINKFAKQNNPRVYSDEQWYSHTSRHTVERLVDLVMKHYPERLSKALVVVGHGNKQYVRSAIGGILALPALISASRTRDKIVFLTRYRDLQNYIERSELPTFVGGTMIEDVQTYECK